MSRPPAETDTGERLQKVLARAGFGSRRACEELIAAGRVEVDGQLVSVQGVRVDPARALIRVDGERLATTPGLVHLAAHKPRGMVSTMSDPRGRPCLGDLVASRTQRLFHVGRLDADSEGLVLLTNDGPLAHRLTHPSFGVSKTYLCEVAGPLPRDLGRRLRAGLELDDGPASVDAFRAVGATASRVLVEVVLHDGRKHVVRRLLAQAGHPVHRLVRTGIGPLTLGDLRAGATRALAPVEVRALYRDAAL